MSQDLVLISLHEKGFWQADLFKNAADLSPLDFEIEGPSPDGFFTMKIGASLDETKAKAAAKWPEARIEVSCETVAVLAYADPAWSRGIVR